MEGIDVLAWGFQGLFKGDAVSVLQGERFEGQLHNQVNILNTPNWTFRNG